MDLFSIALTMSVVSVPLSATQPAAPPARGLVLKAKPLRKPLAHIKSITVPRRQSRFRLSGGGGGLNLPPTPAPTPATSRDPRSAAAPGGVPMQRLPSSQGVDGRPYGVSGGEGRGESG